LRNVYGTTHTVSVVLSIELHNYGKSKISFISKYTVIYDIAWFGLKHGFYVPTVGKEI